MGDEVNGWCDINEPEELVLLKRELFEQFEIHLSTVAERGIHLEWELAVEGMDEVARLAEAIQSNLPDSQINWVPPESRSVGKPFCHVRKTYPDGRLFAAGILEGKDYVWLIRNCYGLEDVRSFPELISEFEALLDLDLPERYLHQFLNKHRYFLCTDYQEVLYEPPITPSQIGASEQSCRADFLIIRKSMPSILVELERATHRIFTKDGEFTKEVRHGLKQLNDWFSLIKDNKATMLKSVNLSSLPDGWLIIGRRQTLSEEELKKLRRYNEAGLIRIFTYDDLLDSARETYNNLQGLAWLE